MLILYCPSYNSIFFFNFKSLFWFVSILGHKQLTRLKAVDNRSIATVRWKWFLCVSTNSLPSQMLYMNQIDWLCIFKHMWPKRLISAKHKYYDKNSRALWIYKDEPVSSSLSSSWTTLCSVKYVQLLILWVLFLPSCRTRLLFLKWFLFANQKSSKREHMAFFFFITIN